MTSRAVNSLSKEELVALVLAPVERIRLLAEQKADLPARVAESKPASTSRPKPLAIPRYRRRRARKRTGRGKRRSHAKDGLELLASSPKPLTMCAKCLPILAPAADAANSRR